MKTPQPLPEELRGRPFTLVDASVAGISPRRWRHGSLTYRGRGIRMESTTTALPLGVRVRPFIEVNVLCAASHVTAAELHSLPQRRQDGASDAYHLIRPEGAAHLDRPHVLVHRMKLYEDEVTTIDGVPVTTPARTWLDMAEMLSLDEIVAMGDACVRVPRPELESRRTVAGITSPTCPTANTGSESSTRANTTARKAKSPGISRALNGTPRWGGRRSGFPSGTWSTTRNRPRPKSWLPWRRLAGGGVLKTIAPYLSF
ncbi:hypothetical protein Achl_0677 [Pseudarthrobacter chlorophenolicus A6]|uniref:Uncharacterized protein n=1 Tax=Pseudarthrobacter chlorophenolicus (strain ATCC 700700 / DSM 12829 / CIP 107037 / JCM 12360 / KCTC 9906 / NCIMB 13794 / A6) TaxID=452863 RepID=B8HBW4_PSECP|nr:hypothetical protein Achl_0677 [Pseudarthrobacter chlorophenolicus A6]SDQ43986.1 hypothetical protein SAMN04489738_0852 [Pseudarthrobacter chlorophenolicus]